MPGRPSPIHLDAHFLVRYHSPQSTRLEIISSRRAISRHLSPARWLKCRFFPQIATFSQVSTVASLKCLWLNHAGLRDALRCTQCNSNERGRAARKEPVTWHRAQTDGSDRESGRQGTQRTLRATARATGKTQPDTQFASQTAQTAKLAFRAKGALEMNPQRHTKTRRKHSAQEARNRLHAYKANLGDGFNKTAGISLASALCELSTLAELETGDSTIAADIALNAKRLREIVQTQSRNPLAGYAHPDSGLGCDNCGRALAGGGSGICTDCERS